MKRKVLGKMLSGIFAVLMLFTCIPNTSQAKWDVKRSEVDYKVELNNASAVFLYNKETIGSEVGTEYYMTYTVEKSDIKEFGQQGIIGTTKPKMYSYSTDKNGDGGLYKYIPGKNLMLVEGRTYFLKFVITKDGYDYRIGWAEGDKSTYFELPSKTGEVKTGLKHFGIFLADKGMNVTLTKVRLYDKKGNDLVLATTGSTLTTSIGRDIVYPKDTEVTHKYDISIKEGSNVAISNLKVPTSNVVYMEYKVKESKDTHIWHSGCILGNTPKVEFPYQDGFMYSSYNRKESVPEHDAGALWVEGAEYFIRFEKKDKELEVIVQRTLNGKNTFINLTDKLGIYDKEAKFFSIWGGQKPYPVNLELVDFKCYDSNKNSLGVQVNDFNLEATQITHKGDLEDYSGCEAMYFNKEDESFFALYDNKSLKYAQGDNKKEGTYEVRDGILSITMDDATEKYEYFYQYFKNEEKEYRRLKEYRIKFETGEGSPVEDQMVNAESGYRAMKPTQPTLKGNKFQGWYTIEGEEFDFDKLIHESVTVYAKWEKAEYTVIDTIKDYTPYILSGAGMLIIVASAVIGGVMLRRRNKHEANKKN